MSDDHFSRIYAYRYPVFGHPEQRAAVWSEVASYLFEIMGRPARLLDPGGGRGEFINAVPAVERWLLDKQESPVGSIDPDVNVLIGNVFDLSLPFDYFDGVFVSNFLEHLYSPNDIARFLGKMFASQAPGGSIAVVGPNFRYSCKSYYDCADHWVPLTHISVDEHLHGAGYIVERVIPRFLPLSFKGRLPPSKSLTRTYLRLPLAWRIFGRQFLVVGKKPSDRQRPNSGPDNS